MTISKLVIITVKLFQGLLYDNLSFDDNIFTSTGFLHVIPFSYSHFYDDMCITIVIISMFLRGTHLKRLLVR